jgi:hypothetical protein
MVDDNYSGSGRPSAEVVQITIRPMNTIGSETLLRCARDGIPQGIIVPYPVKFGAIGEFGFLQPFRNPFSGPIVI